MRTAAQAAAVPGGAASVPPPMVADSCWAICMIWDMLLGSDSSAFSFSSSSAMPRPSSLYRRRESSSRCTSAAPSGVDSTCCSMADSADVFPAAACWAARPRAAVSPPESIPSSARSVRRLHDGLQRSRIAFQLLHHVLFVHDRPPYHILTGSLYVRGAQKSACRPSRQALSGYSSVIDGVQMLVDGVQRRHIPLAQAIANAVYHGAAVL